MQVLGESLWDECETLGPGLPGEGGQWARPGPACLLKWPLFSRKGRPRGILRRAVTLMGWALSRREGGPEA